MYNKKHVKHTGQVVLPDQRSGVPDQRRGTQEHRNGNLPQDKRQDDAEAPPDPGQELLYELSSLDSRISGQTPSESPGSSLALLRLVPHMNIDEWRELGHEAPPDVWHAVELGPEDNLTTALLHHFMKDGTPGYRLDSVSGALLSASFMRKLEEESIRAQRAKSELGIGVFKVDALAHIYAVHGREAARNTIINLIMGLRQNLEPCDTLGRLANGEYSVILPGAGIFKLQVFAEKILKNYNSIIIQGAAKTFQATLSIGLAGGGDLTAEGDALLKSALDMLAKAEAEGGNKIKTSKSLPRRLRHGSVQVHSDEKRFLFSGID